MVPAQSFLGYMSTYTGDNTELIKHSPVPSPIVQISELLSHPLFTVNLQNSTSQGTGVVVKCPTP